MTHLGNFALAGSSTLRAISPFSSAPRYKIQDNKCAFPKRFLLKEGDPRIAEYWKEGWGGPEYKALRKDIFLAAQNSLNKTPFVPEPQELTATEDGGIAFVWDVGASFYVYGEFLAPDKFKVYFDIPRPGYGIWEGVLRGRPRDFVDFLTAFFDVYPVAKRVGSPPTLSTAGEGNDISTRDGVVRVGSVAPSTEIGYKSNRDMSRSLSC